MKKGLKLALCAALSATVLGGCTNGGGSETPSGDTITLTYANWNLGTEEENNLERRMIAAFEDSHPNIRIEVAENISAKDYRSTLTSAAAGGKLPDVFMIDNVPYALSNEWLYDVSELVADDEDYAKISKPVVESTQVNGKTMSIPAGQYLAGYMVNADLFEEANVDMPQIGYTLKEFDAAVKAMTKINQGMIGLANEQNILEWYPNQLDESLGWYTFKDNKFNLNSKAFKQTIKKMQEYAQNNSFDAMDQEQKEEFSGLTEIEAWLGGDIAMFYGGTWLANDFKEANFEWEYIGLPNNKNVIVNDYMGISKDTKHAEAAYEFAKFMTFSKEGIQTRIDLCQENNLIWASLPLINDEELNEVFFEWNSIVGLKEAYENLDNSVVELNKTLPGYADARYESKTGIQIETKENATIGDLLYLMVRVNVNPEDYMAQIEELANKAYNTAVESVTAE